MMGTKIGVSQIFRGQKLFALFALGSCEFVRGALIFFILPIYVHGVLGLPTDMVGIAIAAHYICDTGLRGPSGWLLDRFGQRRVLLPMLLLAFIGLCMIVRHHELVVIVTGSALLGAGMAAIWPATIARVTAQLPSTAYATAMGGVMMAWLMGAGGGAICMSWILGAKVQKGFEILQVIWVVAFFLSVVSMRQIKHVEHRSRAHLKLVIAEMVSVRLLFPGIFVQTFAMGILMPVLVLYVRYILGFNGQMYSLLLICGGSATVLLQVPMGRLVDTYGYKWFLVPGFVLSAIVLPMIVQVHLRWALFLAVAGLGAAYALILPSWNAVLAQSVSDTRRAAMFGIFMTIEGIGMALGPLVGTALWNMFNPTAPFYAAALILLGMSIFYIIAPLDKLFLTNHSQG